MYHVPVFHSLLQKNSMHCLDIHFISLFVNGHLSCFYPLNILNRTTMNICVQVLVWVSVFNSVKCSTGLKKDGEGLRKKLLEGLGWMYFHMLLILLVFLFNFSTLHCQSLERPLAYSRCSANILGINVTCFLLVPGAYNIAVNKYFPNNYF